MPCTNNTAMIHGDREGPDPAATAVFSMRALAALDDLPVGVVLLRPVRDALDGVVDFVFEYVNQWAGYAAGMPRSGLLGQRVLEGPWAPARPIFDGSSTCCAPESRWRR